MGSCGMVKGKLLLLCLIIIVSSTALGEKRIWDGGGGDSLWTTATNWMGDIVPSPGDSVLLDNSLLATSYTVLFPPGNISIAIVYLELKPTNPNAIILVIPRSNTAIPALTCNGTGGIVLQQGAILQNSSGAPSGNAIVCADSLYILNGGQYIHNTDIGHASLIARLSSKPGTEYGTVEFNVPGTASYTLSVSNRVYGNLLLKATASGGNKTYLSTGSNPLLVRGNCTINTGVTYSLNFSGEFSVQRDLQVMGVFNVSTGSNSNSIRIKGLFDVEGILTETGTGYPIILLEGSSLQNWKARGAINNSITIQVNNLAGVILDSPVDIKYKLELIQGKLTTTSTNLLTIQTGAFLIADSTKQTVFIDGPLQKKGIIAGGYFLFPVGSGISQRWLSLKDATGDYIVTYFKAPPSTISTQLDTTLHHISTLEYWTIQTNVNQRAKVELSFDDVNSGGVTELTTLRVAQYQGTDWHNAGASAWSGSAGASGSVVSDSIVFPTAGLHYFSLASSAANQNPLPVKTSTLYIKESEGAIDFTWRITPIEFFMEGELQGSIEGTEYRTIFRFQKEQRFTMSPSLPLPGYRFFRLLTRWRNGTANFSEIVSTKGSQPAFRLQYLFPVIAENDVQVSAVSSRAGKAEFWVMDMQGKVLYKYLFFIDIGDSKLTIPVAGLGAGFYQIFGVSSGLRTKPLRFIKR